MRFSDEEWELVAARAGLAGLAVGAWIGQTAVDGATGHGAPIGLPDLLRLHADVLCIEGDVAVEDSDRCVLRSLVERLDAAVDAVVAEVERGRR